jgi:hypothetical protein
MKSMTEANRRYLLHAEMMVPPRDEELGAEPIREIQHARN